jgi:hypothetical protein
MPVQRIVGGVEVENDLLGWLWLCLQKRGFHSPAFYPSKIKLFWATLCLHRGFLESLQKWLSHSNFR